ncbi:MAG: DUF6240 domain-containing protein, partial [Defluviitaleaceae bacterium]|nr:DUF6240 domain-containing protein [Defluviitaleaceae bacterium]
MEITNETTATRVAAAADIIPADAATAAESPEWRAAPPDGRQTADASNNQPEAQLAEILRSYGLAVTEKNVETLKLMLEHEIALTQNNVARMNQALKLADSTEKALFLFSSEIRLTQAGAAQLDLLSDGLFRIDEKLRELFASISEIADPALRDQLIKIFSSIDNAESFFLREGASVTVLPLTADQTIAPSVQAQGLTAPGEAEETKPPRQIPFITTEPVADNSFQPSIPSVPGASDRIVPNPIDALFQGQLNPAQPAGGE